MSWTINGETLNYRKLVVIDGSKVTTETGIPLGLNINLPDVKAGGADVRLAHLNDDPIAREIECIDVPNNDDVMIWYPFNTTATTSSRFYVYWGNAALTEPAADSTYGSEAVWDANYLGVWHMNHDPNGDAANSIKDSTSNDNHGTPFGSMTTADLVDSDYGKAIEFDGSNDYINVGDIDCSTEINITAVAKITTINSYNSIVCKPYTNGLWNDPWSVYMVRVDSVTDVRLQVSPNSVAQGGVSSKSVTTTDEHVYTGKWDNSTADAFIKFDGGADVKVDDSAPGTIPDRASDTDIGRDESGVGFWTGTIVEVRIANDVRSSNYDLTVHNNLINPTASGTAPFYSSIISFETGLFDCKIRIKDVITGVVDGKVQVKDVITGVVDGKAQVKDVLSGLADCKARIKDVISSVADGKVKIIERVTDIVDGKVKLFKEITNVIDGKARIKDVSTAVADGKVIVKDTIDGVLDGKVQVKDVLSGIADGKVKIIERVTDVIDGKVILKYFQTNLLDGRVWVKDITTDIVDGKVQVKDIVSTLLDGKANIVRKSSSLFDGLLNLIREYNITIITDEVQHTIEVSSEKQYEIIMIRDEE